MKKASFSWKAKSSTIYGTVTLKDNGKVSVSMPYANKYNTSAAERYQAKQLALAIVAADFKHDAVTSLTIENTHGLVVRLTEETKELLRVYIERTKAFAKRSYDRAESMRDWTADQYIEVYGTRELPYPRRDSKGNLITHGLSKHGQEVRAEVAGIMYYTFEQYEQREVELAKEHYKNSIERLAVKLNRKGIKDDTDMEMKSTQVGINLETIIYHEGTITKAWTIFAAENSAIVAPHYRYLVK